MFKIDPKITLGIGIGFMLSSLTFIIVQPNFNVDVDNQLFEREVALNETSKEVQQLFANEQTNNDVEGYDDIDNCYESSDQTFKIEIPRGLTADEISLLLEEHEIISDAKKFVNTLLSEGKVTSLRPGVYELPENPDKELLIDKLTSGP
ncbi:hypothetical protein [Natranaerobius trueperi]|uniref:Uncharacterized protein n=1 Tax=Natranaerobius trueperi TaxID=759412 RepID=A0A226BYY7_9FIRM|nr:hypothetical protein [Natranaerobius trueperi]OWZ84258.1 hypothetical protein CDO51_04160 [Natranaerobius trueperi]